MIRSLVDTAKHQQHAVFTPAFFPAPTGANRSPSRSRKSARHSDVVGAFRPHFGNFTLSIFDDSNHHFRPKTVAFVFPGRYNLETRNVTAVLVPFRFLLDGEEHGSSGVLLGSRATAEPLEKRNATSVCQCRGRRVGLVALWICGFDWTGDDWV